MGAKLKKKSIEPLSKSPWVRVSEGEQDAQIFEVREWGWAASFKFWPSWVSEAPHSLTHAHSRLMPHDFRNTDQN